MSGLEANVTLHRPDGFELSVDLNVPVGRTVALLGPNGAGKSTLVSALAGLIPIESGRVVLNESVLDDPRVDIFVPAEERRIGVVFQDFLLFPHLNVLDNVSFGLINGGASRHDAAVISQDWLNRFGLDGLGQRKTGTLSGGQAQRVALARAMVTDPDLLLLDEPLGALDVTTRAEMRHLLSDHLASFDGPRLLITHDPTEAFLLADEVHVIEEGKITQSGLADDIRLRPRTRYAADLAGANLIAGLARKGAVDTGSWTVHIADREISGPVLATILPQAISIHSRPPGGSPRNTWQTTVERTEQLGSRVRIRTGPPVPLTVEVTKDALDELSVHAGSRVWVAIKATEIGVQPDV